MSGSVDFDSGWERGRDGSEVFNSMHDSRDRHDAGFVGRSADPDPQSLPLPAPDQLLPQRRLRRDHEHGHVCEFDLRAARKRADEIDGALPASLQLDNGPDVDRFARVEWPQGEGFVALDGLPDLRGLARLCPGQIRGFEAARVVFVLRFALLVCRLGVRRAGRAPGGPEASCPPLFTQASYSAAETIVTWLRIRE